MRDPIEHTSSEALLALRSISDDTREVYAKRIARKYAGFTLIFAAVIIAAACFFTASLGSELPLYALLAAWPSAMFVYGVTLTIAGSAFRYELTRTLGDEARRTQGEVALMALARLRARAIVEPREQASFSALLAGVALLGPMTIHWAAGNLLSLLIFGTGVSSVNFSWWIGFCGAAFGHVHLVFAYSAAKYARTMSELGSSSLASNADDGGSKAVNAAVIASMFPWLLLLAIPPLFTLLTGTLLLPIFAWARRTVLHERRTIERACLPSRDDHSPETFDEIRSVAEWKRGSPDVRALALRALAERFSKGRVAPVLERVIVGSNGFVRDAALEVAIAIHYRPDLEMLLAVSPFAPERTAQLIAMLLEHYEDPRVEPVLITLLERHERNVLLAACKSLARVGTRGAVEPLLKIADGIEGSELRGAARRAITNIQYRLGSGERGELSVVGIEEDGGSLSFAHEEGALAYAELEPSPEKN